MVKRVDRPFVYNWFAWHLYHRHRKRKSVQRFVAWQFINHLRTLPPDSLAIDGGANVGNVSIAFLRHGFEVHAFEPDPYALTLLKGRCGRNPRLHLYPAAVGASSGELQLYRTKSFDIKPRKATISSSLFKTDNHDERHSVTVPVVDLIEFILQRDRPVSILKLDVEGAEAAILQRILDEKIHQQIGAIYVETHEWFSEGLRRHLTAIRRQIELEKLSHIQLDWM